MFRPKMHMCLIATVVYYAIWKGICESIPSKTIKMDYFGKSDS